MDGHIHSHIEFVYLHVTHLYRFTYRYLCTYTIVSTKFYLASAFDDDRTRCLRSGMNDVVLKPIKLPVLVKAIENAITINK